MSEDRAFDKRWRRIWNFAEGVDVDAVAKTIMEDLGKLMRVREG